MSPFQVWLRPLGDSCRVRVDGIGNTRWLLDHLERHPAIRAIGKLDVMVDDTVCSFYIQFHSSLSLQSFGRLVREVPEVRVMLEPA
jgi:hypothetical protein